MPVKDFNLSNLGMVFLYSARDAVRQKRERGRVISGLATRSRFGTHRNPARAGGQTKAVFVNDELQLRPP